MYVPKKAHPEFPISTNEYGNFIIRNPENSAKFLIPRFINFALFELGAAAYGEGEF